MKNDKCQEHSWQNKVVGNVHDGTQGKELEMMRQLMPFLVSTFP